MLRNHATLVQFKLITFCDCFVFVLLKLATTQLLVWFCSLPGQMFNFQCFEFISRGRLFAVSSVSSLGLFLFCFVFVYDGHFICLVFFAAFVFVVCVDFFKLIKRQN